MSGIARFMSRWSRLKRQPAAPAAKVLPPLESLGVDADLSAYLGREVEASLRRRALARIFSDPCFNLMDGLDVYIDDYSIADPIPADMLAQMNSARLLFDDAPGEEQPALALESADADAGIATADVDRTEIAAETIPLAEAEAESG